MHYLTYVLLGAIVVLFLVYARVNRRRLEARASAQQAAIEPGTEVMTTSGLYATVVAVDADRAVLSIAPGVETTWALAALRPVADLPAQYAGGPGGYDEPDASYAEDGPDPAAPRPDRPPDGAPPDR